MLKGTVIGGYGFIGSALVRALQQLGWECDVVGRESVWPVQGQYLGHVFYCAGLTANYGTRPFDTVQAHTALLSQVLASSRWDTLVYLSSTRLYDYALLAGDEKKSCNECSDFVLNPLHARHIFDLTKLTGEALCHAMGQGRARVARLACVVGDGNDAHGFLPMLLRSTVKALANTDSIDSVRLDSSGSFQRDYVLLEDALQALIAIAISGKHACYNIASGKNILNRELTDTLNKHLLGRVLFEYSRTDIQNSPTIDTRLLSEIMDWQPTCVLSQLHIWMKQLLARNEI